MHRRHTILCLTIAAASVYFGRQNLVAEIIDPEPLEGKIHWVYDYEEGKQLARNNGKPLMVIFRCER